MFFGSYLVVRRLATAAQVMRALDEQHQLRTPIGRIAVREGRMTPGQVIETLRVHDDYDLDFGKTAVKLGFLNQEDVDRFLQMQRREAPPIGKLLVDLGIIDQPIMEAALTDFHKRSKPRVAPVEEALQHANAAELQEV